MMIIEEHEDHLFQMDLPGERIPMVAKRITKKEEMSHEAPTTLHKI
ncbi:hypothetical protein [Heliorestis convoluta]|uniref:Uncharacterized protein n=1 Tax=Heliorestis convoluta TaxID=356322 RepID=A0A5Q2N0N5_9FIRM|nr:hypothetical protein [Heliorestis convoluta]QGG47881.1 hypothetical protein FTV88_1783 [Heliorestis convoluta]